MMIVLSESSVEFSVEFPPPMGFLEHLQPSPKNSGLIGTNPLFVKWRETEVIIKLYQD
jgi:hypothetical protein